MTARIALAPAAAILVAGVCAYAALLYAGTHDTGIEL